MKHQDFYPTSPLFRPTVSRWSKMAALSGGNNRWDWSAAGRRPRFSVEVVPTFGSVVAQRLALTYRDERLSTQLYRNHLEAVLASMPVADLLASDVDRVIDGIDRSVSTKNRCRKIVRDTLDVAVRAGYCIENVANKPKPWGNNPPDGDAFASRFSAALAFLHQEDPAAAALMALAAASNVSLDRLLTLCWWEIDFERECLRSNCDEDDVCRDERPDGPALGFNATFVLLGRYFEGDPRWKHHVFQAADGSGPMKMPFAAIKRALLKAGLPDTFGAYSLEGLHESEAVQACVLNFAQSISPISL
ncbi:MAG TPA: hypothetical protein VF447_00530 [Terriglobales bacterium]